MTDLTDDQVRALLDGATPGPWRADGEPWNRIVWSSADNRVCFMAHSSGLNDARDIATSNLIAAAPVLARALLAALAELARVKADAAAAQALVVEQAATQADPWDGPVTKNKIVDAQAIAAQQIKARIRALAPADGLAAVEALRVEARENAMQALASMGQAQEAYEAQLEAEAELAAAQQREAALTKALEACVASLERVDTAEGVCCCGDSMDRHSDPMSCGHSPVDMGDYYAGQALESARAALAQTPTDPGDGWTWNERLGWIGPDGKPADPRRRG